MAEVKQDVRRPVSAGADGDGAGLRRAAAGVARVRRPRRRTPSATQRARDSTSCSALSQKIPVAGERALAGSGSGVRRLSRNRVRASRRSLQSLGPDVQSFDASHGTAQAQSGDPRLARSDRGRAEGGDERARARAAVAAEPRQRRERADGLQPADKEGSTRHLGRFELTGLRLQQDLEALAGGVGDATAIARRLADGNRIHGSGGRRPRRRGFGSRPAQG